MSIKDSHFSSEEGPQGITAICVHTLNDTRAIFPWRKSLEHSLCDKQALTFDGWVLAASDTPWVRQEDLASDPSLSSPLAGSVPTAWLILGGTRAVCTLGKQGGEWRGCLLECKFPTFPKSHQLPLLLLQLSLQAWPKGPVIRVCRTWQPQETLAVNLFWSRTKWIRAAGCDRGRQTECHWSQGLPALWQSIPGHEQPLPQEGWGHSFRT